MTPRCLFTDCEADALPSRDWCADHATPELRGASEIFTEELPIERHDPTPSPHAPVRHPVLLRQLARHGLGSLRRGFRLMRDDAAFAVESLAVGSVFLLAAACVVVVGLACAGALLLVADFALGLMR